MVILKQTACHMNRGCSDKPLQVTKGHGNEGRKAKTGSCMHSYMQIKLIEQLLTIRLAPRCCYHLSSSLTCDVSIRP